MPKQLSHQISIVICTRDRPKLLTICLNSVVKQLREGDEIIVVDNSTSHSGYSVAQSYGARWISELRPGSSWARNRGWQEALHEIIVYIDDDCIADIVWVEELRKPFDNPVVGVVTGSVLGERTDLAISNLVDISYPFHRGWKSISYSGSTGTKWSPLDIWRVGVGGNMAWRRSVLQQIKGFDPALGAGTPAGSSEDIDALRRAIVQGITIHYQPSALVWHKHPEHISELRQMLIRYAITLGAHAMKMIIEERRWRALVYLFMDCWDQIAWAIRLIRSKQQNHQLQMPALTILLQPLSSLLGMVRFVWYRKMLRSGQMPQASFLNKQGINNGLAIKSGIASAEIELTEDSLDEIFITPTWLLIRMQKRPVVRVYMNSEQTIIQVLEEQGLQSCLHND